MERKAFELKCRHCVHYKLSDWLIEPVCAMMGFPVGPDDAACISIFKKEDEMARPAIDIILDAKRKIEKRRINYCPAPFCDASQAAELCDPSNFMGNNKSEYIRKLATAAAYIICEIETIQAIKGDGILK